MEIAMGKILGENVAWFRINFTGLGSKFRPFSIYQHTLISQKPFIISLWFFTLLKVRIEAIKNSKHHQLKVNRSHYTNTLPKL